MKILSSFSRALCAGIALTNSHSAWAQSDILARFGSPVQIFGNMIRNDITFVDGMQVNVYSPTNRTLTVEQNEKPLAATFVTGTTGENFKLALGYSYKFTTNDEANDVIAQIAIPYTPAVLTNRSLSAGNTYVGQLTSDGKSWNVVSQDRTVETAEFKTQMSQMTSLTGEFILLVRNTQDQGNVFLEYGTGDQFSANFTGGPGLQDVEYMDGLSFAVQSDQPMRMNVVLEYPIDMSEIPSGMISLNSYAWVINTTVNAEIPQGGVGGGVAGSNTTSPGGNSTTPAVITAGLPLPAASIQPALSSSAFVYVQPYGNRIVRRAPFAIPQIGSGNGRGSDSSPYDDEAGIGQAQAAQAPTSQLMPPNPTETSGKPLVSTTSQNVVSDSVSVGSIPTNTISRTIASGSAPVESIPTISATSVPMPSIKSSAIPASAPTKSVASPLASTTPAAAQGTDIQSARIQFPVNMQILEQRLLPSGTANGASSLANLDLNSIAFMIGRRDAGSKAPFTAMNVNSNANLTATPSTFASAGISSSPSGRALAIGNSTVVPLATSASAGVSPTAKASGSATPSAATQGFTISNGRIAMDISGAPDGEYVILVPITQGIGGAALATQSAGVATGSAAAVKANTDSTSSAPGSASLLSKTGSIIGLVAAAGIALCTL